MRITKIINIPIVLWLVILMLTGCGDGSDQAGNINIVGAIQKGPFIVGSTVTINRLSEHGENTDSTIITNTTDDLGNFKFSIDTAGLVQISSTGYYRNEITGELSSGTLTLRSIYQVTEETDQHAHVNLLTHIVSYRILSLIKNGDMQFEQAVRQAEGEFLSSFNEVISNLAEQSFTSLSILGGELSLGSPYLLSVSAILYQYAIQQSISNSTNPDAELSLLVNELEFDFGDDGIINDTSKLAALRDVIPLLNPVQIHENINSWISETSEYNPADINEYLDSDLDGVFNISDQDDDNDGIDDVVDTSPYTPGFLVSNQEVTTDEDISIVLNVSSNNPMDDVIALEITQQPSNGSIVGSYPMLTYIPNINYSGVDEFKYALSQSSITSEEVTVFIVIQPINDSPVISGTPSNEITAHNSYSFTPMVLNIEADQLSFSIENIPNWASFDDTTGQLYGTPLNDDAGSYSNILISVSDGFIAIGLPAFNINVTTNPWKIGPAMPTERGNGGVTIVGNEIYLIGGGTKNSAPNYSVESFDVGSSLWSSAVSSMPTYTYDASAYYLNNNIYVFSDSDGVVQEYDPVTAIWNTKANNIARSHVSSTSLSGKLYTVGGYSSSENRVLDDVDMYNPATDVWSVETKVPEPLRDPIVCSSANKIYVVGGLRNYFDPVNPSNNMYVYDTTLAQWTVLEGKLMGTYSYGRRCIVHDNKLFFFGGLNSLTQNPTNLAEAYDLVLNNWITLTNSPVEKWLPSVILYGQQVFIFGGMSDYSTRLNSVEVYTPALDPALQ